MRIYPKKLLIILVSIFFFFIHIPQKTVAQNDVTGFIRNYNGVITTPDHDILVGRNRFRFDLQHSFSAGEIVVSNDVQNFYNHAIDSASYRLREAYADLYFKHSDLRVGRQIISWGRADGAFIADILTPVDLSEFLTQDFSDLRTGVNAITYIRYFGANYLQLVANPVFNPNTTPRPGSRWFPRTFFGDNISTLFQEYELQPTLKNAQFGGRLALRSNLNYDLDLGVLYWHYPNPSYSKNFVQGTSGQGNLLLSEDFTQSLVLIYSGTLQVADRLLFTSEMAYYTDRLFDYLTPELRAINYKNISQAERAQLAQIFQNNEDGFLKSRPWLTGMAGLEYKLADLTISAQVVDEYIFNYDEQILQEQHYTYATLRLQHSFWQEKLEISGFARYNMNGEDFWLNPELTYSGIDNIEAAIGTQLFGGPDPERFYGHLSFNNYEQNSFGYLKFTAFF